MVLLTLAVQIISCGRNPSHRDPGINCQDGDADRCVKDWFVCQRLDAKESFILAVPASPDLALSVRLGLEEGVLKCFFSHGHT
jgi:hypothetical protein